MRANLRQVLAKDHVGFVVSDCLGCGFVCTFQWLFFIGSLE
jgi:hypothetical protein